MKRELRADKLRDTAEKVQQQISTAFPDSGLAAISAQVVEITKEALVRAESIRRPNIWLRAALGILVVIAIGGIVVYLDAGTGESSLWRSGLHFLDDAKGSAALLTATAIFLFTYETRIKRKRALNAIHELRAIAHIIDMHQLTKDPDIFGGSPNRSDVEETPMSAEAISSYLHFCTELLAVTSKIGQLYIQDFPDALSVAAVDQFEELATGLSSKIWQKLMILDLDRFDIRSKRAKQLNSESTP